MTDDQHKTAMFIINWLSCIASLVVIFLYAINVTETARKNAHDWSVTQEMGQ